MSAAPSLAPQPSSGRGCAPLALVPPLPPPRYIGLAQCANEGWTVMRYPVSRPYLFAAGPWRVEIEMRRRLHAAELRELRRRGAIVVACQASYMHKHKDHHRIWWFGLPPAEWRGDLRALAGDAGMLGDPPRTFSWHGKGQD